MYVFPLGLQISSFSPLSVGRFDARLLPLPRVQPQKSHDPCHVRDEHHKDVEVKAAQSSQPQSSDLYMSFLGIRCDDDVHMNEDPARMNDK